jgi:hypothetical protein
MLDPLPRALAGLPHEGLVGFDQACERLLTIAL